MKRRPRKHLTKLINLWVPSELVPAIDLAVKLEDSDRSKFIRSAIREKIERGGREVA